jgi:zinc protease
MVLARIDEIDHRRGLEFYRRSFANAADFAFFFVGNLDVEQLIPALESTLGTLPSTGEPRSRWVDHEVLFPEEIVRETVRAGTEPKGRTALTFPSYDGQDPREWHRLRTAASIVERRLRESLREDLGATYGVSARYAHSIVGPARGKVAIRFGCDPAEAEALGAEVFRVLEELSEAGPTPEEVAKEKEIQSRDLETSLERNGFWMGSLSSLWLRDRSFLEILNRQARIDELDRASLHRVFHEYFTTTRYTWVSWEPEADEAG